MTINRQWTFMVYMAGDNGKIFEDGSLVFDDLQKYGWQNLADMAKASSTDQVAIIAQYDTLDNDGYTPRFYLDTSSPTGILIEKIPLVNTGDPKNLTDFIVWAETNYPAKKYALIIWNHGTGWKEDDIYARYREKIELAHSKGETRAGLHGNRLLKQALFIPTVGEIMSIENNDARAICYDDSSMSFLDNKGLSKALGDAQSITGKQLALIGMDACLMSMIEVAYEIQTHANVLVGSQEIEQGEGWPYYPILETLNRSPEMSAKELGMVIVKEFGSYYMQRSRNSGGINTQSAIDLSKMQVLADYLKNLVDTAIAHYDNIYIERAINRARVHSQKFHDKDYLDLFHFLDELSQELEGNSNEILYLANQAKALLKPQSSDGVILQDFHGASRKNANGLSIYFPYGSYSPYYDEQKFSVYTKWNMFLKLVDTSE